MYRRLFIFIEGSDDARFFDRVVKPIFEQEYDHVQIWEYVQRPTRKARLFIGGVKAMSGEHISADYIFVTDIDRSPCVTHRKQVKQNEISNIDKERIVVVIKEIEGWYLAGLDDVCSKKCGIRPCNATDTIIKEQFDSMTPKKFQLSRIDFLQEILKFYQVEVAKRKNKSFKYFLQKYGGN